MSQSIQSTTIASFDVKITTEGLIVIDKSLADADEFESAMDNWNPEYENTPVIASLLKYYKGVFDLMIKDTQKAISS